MLAEGEVLIDRAIDIIDRLLRHVPGAEDVERNASVRSRIGIGFERFGADDVARGWIDYGVERIDHRRVHARAARRLLPLVLAILIIGVEHPPRPQFAGHTDRSSKHIRLHAVPIPALDRKSTSLNYSH